MQFKRRLMFCLDDLVPPWLRHWSWDKFTPILTFLSFYAFCSGVTVASMRQKDGEIDDQTHNAAY